MEIVKRIRRILWYISILSLLLVFILYWEYRNDKIVIKQLEEQSIIIREALWIVDSEAPIQYLKLAAAQSNYESITIYLHSFENPFLIVKGHEISALDSFLVSIGLIPKETYNIPVLHDDKKIGSFTAVAFNKSVYTYLYALLVAVLCSLGLNYFFETIEAKKLLEQRVLYRTRELKESEKMYRTLVGNIPGVSFRSLYDEFSTMKLISDEIEKISGHPGSDFIDNSECSFTSIIFPDDLERYREVINSAVQKKIPFSIQFRIKSRYGSIHWVFEKGLGIFDADGNIQFIDGVIIDITEQKHTEDEKALLQDQLNHKSRMDALGQLAGGMAHDFNNMLSGIMNSAQLLQLPQNNLGEKPLKYVELIIKASNRTSDLISKLLAYGRKGKMASSSIDINIIIKDTIDILSRTIDKKIKLSYKANAQNHILVGDNSSIQSALLNLGINASHAMPQGGDIEISTKNTLLSETYCEASSLDINPGEFIEVEFRDTGSGIPVENLQKIFEPFFTTKEQGVGTGLGLSAVYGTVMDHHGTIHVYSELETGTVFKIQFPCSKVDVKPLPLKKNLTQGTGRILLVDDEEIIRITGQAILENMGYQVLTAENGKEAIEIFKNRCSEIDLVLMDMIMPKMDGREAFTKIREIDNNSKIIIASGFSKDEHLKELKESGLNGFIRKPFSAFELSQLISSILNHE